MTTEVRWQHLDTFLRRGPYVLLLVAALVAFITAPTLTPGVLDGIAMAVSVPTLAFLHWWCADRRWNRSHLTDWLGSGYVLVRTAAAFALTWLNPFFALFAVMGYFDFHVYLARRWSYVVLLTTSVTLAGSQSGGLPPDSRLQLALFIALLFVNAVIVILMSNAAAHESHVAQKRDETIIDLEQTRERLEHALTENAQLQAKLVRQAHEAGAHEERERLALEIHDTIAQDITGIITQLEAVTGHTSDAATAERIDHAATLARNALGEARRSVQGLLPSQLGDTGLADALSRMTDDWSANQGVHAEFLVTGVSRPVHRDVEAAVVRVAQEALTNVAKHARATRVGVTLSYTEDDLVLDVRDDGIGFADGHIAAQRPPLQRQAGGVGLHGIRQRAAKLAGELVIEGEPHQGTALCLRVPVACHE